MAHCKLNWADRSEELFKAIRDAGPGLVQRSWIELIVVAGFRRLKDYEAFKKFLIRILEAGDAFPENIRISALRRLHNLVEQIQPKVSFVEKHLNLLLPKK